MHKENGTPLITFNMIAEHLTSCSTVSVPMRKTPGFERVMLLDDDRPLSEEDVAGLVDSTLFCGSGKAACRLLESSRDAYALCLQQHGNLDERLRKHADRVLVLQAEEAAYDVYARIEGLLASVESWIRRMKTALLDGGDCQSLLNCSESMLQNFVMVSNSDFRLLAYTQHIPIDDPTTKLVIEQGVHPQETIELFKKYHVTKDWKAQSKIELKPASKLTVNPVLDYVFRMQGNYYVHVIMHCNKVPPTPGLADIFQILIDHLGSYVRRNWNEHLLSGQEPGRLFGDLIQRKSFGKRALEARLRGLDIPETGDFALFAFLFIAERSEDQLLPFYANLVKESFPWCHVGVYSPYILALDPKAKLPQSEPQLQAFANAHPCSIGMSNPFDQLADFPFAFNQAKAAIEIATSQNQSLSMSYRDDHPSPLYRFSECFAAYVSNVANNNNQLVAYCVENGILAHIAAFDEKHGTDDLRILFHYLANERKVSVTCEALFLHRNTLLYHIKRLQERFGFDLDDYHTRQQIMMEYLLAPARR